MDMFDILKTYNEKKCYACGHYRPFEDFKERPGTVDGYHTFCKVCAKKGYSSHFSGSGRHNGDSRFVQRNETYHKMVYQVSMKVLVARKNGTIEPIETKTCLICRQPALHWHHPDYSKPLDVVPLCRRCHFWGHNGLLPKHILREHFPGVLPRYR